MTGAMATTRNQPGWWGQRWLQYVAKELLGRPLRTTRRSVTRLMAEKGRITAVVGADTFQPATVTVKVKPFGERDWRRALDVIAGNAEAAHRLLSGHPGAELEAILKEEGLTLFPQRGTAAPIRCTCRRPWECRHEDAVVAHLAGMLDASPVLWLELMGRDRATLLAALRARLADQAGAAAEGALTAEAGGAPLDPDRFWATAEEPEAIPMYAGSAVTPDALLRLLGPLPVSEAAPRVSVWVPRETAHNGVTWQDRRLEKQSPDWLLRRFVTRIGQAAAELARGGRPPDYREQPQAGRPVPLRARLALEVEAAVRQAEACLSVKDLQTICPTAAALPEDQAVRGLADALTALPTDLAVLAGRYVGPRSALLAGAAFRHVVTFDEWRAGRLKSDADWVRVLAMAGHRPPFRVLAGSQRCEVLNPDDRLPGPPKPGSLFALLRPEVGDELRLAVADPAALVLVAALRRRSDRHPAEPLVANRDAILRLLAHMKESGNPSLGEHEAVAVLAATGSYGADPGPDPIWLLPTQGETHGMYFIRQGRQVTTERWRSWGWSPGHTRQGTAREWQHDLNWFVAKLSNEGYNLKQVDAATRCVTLWYQHWAGAQHLPGRTPTLNVFLDFLWNVAPTETRRHKLNAGLVPQALAAWFAFLEERYPAVRGAYTEHVAACGLTAAYEDRVRTLPGGRGRELEALAWRLEGARWLGPKQHLDL